MFLITERHPFLGQIGLTYLAGQPMLWGWRRLRGGGDEEVPPTDVMSDEIPPSDVPYGDIPPSDDPMIEMIRLQQLRQMMGSEQGVPVSDYPGGQPIW